MAKNPMLPPRKPQDLIQSKHDKVHKDYTPDGYHTQPNNGVEGQIKRISEGVGRLTAMLCKKGILSKEEVLEIVGVCSYHHDEYEIIKEE